MRTLCECCENIVRTLQECCENIENAVKTLFCEFLLENQKKTNISKRKISVGNGFLFEKHMILFLY